jgi:hypothetical protein
MSGGLLQHLLQYNVQGIVEAIIFISHLKLAHNFAFAIHPSLSASDQQELLAKGTEKSLWMKYHGEKVPVVEQRSKIKSDKKCHKTYIQVGAPSIGHRQNAGIWVFQLKVFICKLLIIYWYSTHAIVLHEISTLWYQRKRNFTIPVIAKTNPANHITPTPHPIPTCRAGRERSSLVQCSTTRKPLLRGPRTNPNVA